MKKIITVLVITIGLFSCDLPTIKNKDLPIEVVTIKEQNKFDTILTIKTEKYTYLFDKKEYKGSYKNKSDDFGLALCLIFIFFIFGVFTGLALND